MKTVSRAAFTRAAVALGLFAMGCAGPLQPPALSPNNPADPQAGESATPPLEPELMREANLAEEQPAQAAEPQQEHSHHQHPPAAQTTPPKTGHEGHMPAEPPSYTCPTHPEVKQASPGQCPIDGKELTAVKKAAKEPPR